MDTVVKYYEGEMRKKDEEIDYWKRKSFLLQNQSVFHREELDAYKVKLDASSMELQEKNFDSYLVEGKLKDLTNVVSTTERDELSYNTMCDKLKEQIEELKTRCQESVAQAELKLKCEVDLERQLKECKTQCSEMYEESKRYKMTCDQLNEQNEEFKRRCKDLETQAESGLEKQVGLEKQLNDYKAKCSEMYEKLKRYKMTCSQLNEQNQEFKRRCKEVETQVDSRPEKQVDSEKQLNDHKAKYSVMHARFKEGKERVVALESDLKEYMRICGELNEQVESLDDKLRATSGEAAKWIDKLITEIMHLGGEKRKVEDENEVVKTKMKELESKTAMYLKELDDYKVKSHGLSVELKEKEMEFVEYKGKLNNLALTTNAFVDELEGYKTALNGLKELITGLAEDRKKFSEREKKAEERIAYLQEVIKSRESKLCSSPNVDRDEHVSGHLVKLAGDMGNAASLFKMEFANTTNEKTNFEIEEREIAVFKQDNLQPGNFVQMGSNEDDRDTRPKHTCDAGNKRRLNVSTGDTIERSSNCTSSKRPFFDQKGEECGIKCKAVDIPLSSAPKRKSLPETVNTDRQVEPPKAGKGYRRASVDRSRWVWKRSEMLGP